MNNPILTPKTTTIHQAEKPGHVVITIRQGHKPIGTQTLHWGAAINIVGGMIEEIRTAVGREKRQQGGR